MKIIIYLSISLILIVPLTLRASTLELVDCETVTEPELRSYITEKNYSAVVMTQINKHLNSSTTTKIKCENILSLLHIQPNIGEEIFTKSILQDFSKNFLSKCNDRKNYISEHGPCTDIPGSIPEIEFSINPLLGFFTPPKHDGYSQDDCNCIVYSVEKKGGVEKFMNSDVAQKTKSDMIKKIRQDAINKIQNTYAKYVEDISYYLSNQSNTLGGYAKQGERNLYCKNIRKIKKNVSDSCGNKDIDKELLEIFPGDETTTNPAKKLDDFHNQISLFEYKTDAGIKRLSRHDYDTFRYGLRKTPQEKFVNSFITAFHKSPELNKKLNKKFDQDPTITPLKAIREIVNESGHDELLKLIKRYNPSVLGPLAESLKDASKIQHIFFNAIKSNPGIKNLLLNQNFFKQAQLLKGNGTTLQLVEETDTLESLYANQCDDFQKQIAEFICASEDEALNNANYASLAQFDVGKNVDQQTVRDLLACKAKEKSEYTPHNSVFFNNVVDYADYMREKSGETSEIGHFAHKIWNDKKLKDQVSSIIEHTKPSQTVAKAVTRFHSRNTDANSISFDTGVSSQNSGNSFDEAISNFISDLPQSNANQFSGNFVANTNFAFSGQNDISRESPEKKFLKDYLSKNSSLDPDEINDHLSSVTNSDAEELLRIQEEIKLQKSLLEEVKRENDKLKLAQLEQKYAQMENRLASLSQNDKSDRKDLNGPSVKSSGGHVSATRSQSGDNYYNPQQDSNGIHRESPSFSSINKPVEGVELNSLSKSNSNSANKSDFSANSLESSVVNKALIITSATGSISGSNSGKVISSDVIAYLQKIQFDTSALKEIKESGFIYTFEEVNVQGQKVIVERKIQYAELDDSLKKLIDAKLLESEIQNKRQFSLKVLQEEILSSFY